ncbi:MAG: hypothetical protein LUG83_07125 [Lachnospiraceae bacterium]|nr:hypothetical protein [Lachnospiraceae bacterium]
MEGKNKRRILKKGLWITGGVDAAVFALLLAVYTAVTLYLFINQCYQTSGFVSDMPDYVNKVAGIEGDYEFPYPLFFWLGRIFAVFSDAPMGTALATAFLNMLGICVSKYYMDRAAIEWNIFGSGNTGEKRALRGLSVTFMVFALFILGNLYSPKGTAFFGFDYTYRCMGIYTPNPIWNATYMAARPFAVICFFEGVRLLKLIQSEAYNGSGKGFVNEVKNFSWREAVPFAVSLFLTTITKPSYTMVVVPALAAVLLIQLVQTKGRSFSGAFALCLTMIPTGIALLYQFRGVFMGTNIKGEQTGIGFGIAKVWGYYSSNIPLSVIMGMALPALVLALNIRELKKNAYYRFAWLNWLVSAVMFLCLYEKGFRMLHANFSWGYMHGMFFVFMITLLLIIKNTVQWVKSYKIIFAMAEWALLLYHLACGAYFLLYALQGNELSGF